MTTQLELDKWQMKKNTDDICKNYHKNNPMSVESNKIAHKGKIPARRLIWNTVADHEIVFREGMTCEQIETETGLSHQTCSARLSELRREGKIKIIGTRKTKSGSPASVYQST